MERYVCENEKSWVGSAVRVELPDEICGGEQHEEVLDVLVDGGVDAHGEEGRGGEDGGACVRGGGGVVQRIEECT